MSQDVQRRQMIRDVLLWVYEKRGGYRGDGSNWANARFEDIDRILESGAHMPVLRDETFCRHLFPEPIGVSGGIPLSREIAEPHHTRPSRLIWIRCATAGTF